MGCENTSQASLEGLRRLRKEAAERGDHCFAIMLAGVELYASLGREMELIEAMKKFADEMQDVVHQTPTARELEDLFFRDTWKKE